MRFKSIQGTLGYVLHRGQGQADGQDTLPLNHKVQNKCLLSF